MNFLRDLNKTLLYSGTRPFLLSGFFSSIGSWIYIVGMTTLIYEKFGAFAVAMFAATRQILYVILSPFSGYLIDNYSNKKLLVRINLLSILCMIMLLLFTLLNIHFTIFYIIIVLILVFTSTVDYPLRLALVTGIVEKPYLLVLNSALNAVGTISLMISPLFGSLILNFKGLEGAFAINILIYFSCLAFVLLLPKSINNNYKNHKFMVIQPEKQFQYIIKNWIQGFSFVFQQKKVFASNFVLFINHIVLGTVFAFIPMISDINSQGSVGIGYLMTANGLGSVIGTFASAYWGKKKVNLTILISVLGVGLSCLLCGMFKYTYISYFSIMLIGLFAMLGESPILTLIQEVTPEDIAGRVYAAVDVIIIGGMGLGSLLAGCLLYKLPFKLILNFTAAIALLTPLLVGKFLNTGSNWDNGNLLDKSYIKE